ncbi:asparaginase [Desulfuribacillus alkaliarsenatis]|uniref:asparaginase n=1 Tax=Desulfuribacillus alkaliarsenatis TaxID=766136 RepID=A0A1E5G5K9_9FIRM|nr:asparaginase domain-containing protein [Desulfuribacillus alkaliarsenatis]OEF98389.1 hypothetical protein BHF68_01545 [Desulfuribacillus alkaliarsenatis]
MKQILLMITGGTIGSAVKGEGIDVAPNATNILLDLFNEHYDRSEVEFTIRQPLQILSENIVPADWQLLIDALNVELAKNDNYDGVIITHGTDTLPYTAAAMSYLFADTKIPIVLIASNQPIKNEQTDGFVNFVSAVDLIANNPIPKVVCIFQNRDKQVNVYLGTRMMQSLAFIHDYDIFPELNLGIMSQGRLEIQKSKHTNETIFKNSNNNNFKNFNNRFSDEILYIKPYPGLRYDYLKSIITDERAQKPKAILHDLYHSGTAATMGEYSVVDFINSAIKQGIDCYVTSIEKKPLDYATTNDILSTGVVPIYNMLTEAALPKLMLAYGNQFNKTQIEFFLNEQTVAAEHLKL